MGKTSVIKSFSLLLLWVVGFGANAQRMSNQEYIELYKDIAMQEMRAYKIPASITLAQGILESGSGNSRLSKEGNNHFGIKCKKNWTGQTIIEDDDEKNECFRAYSYAHESYKDHSLFLVENTRYAFLFEYSILDYKSWAEGLRKAGYATNQRYPELLIGIIERNNLARFDTMVFYGIEGNIPEQINRNTYKANIQIVDNGIPLTVSKPGQTAQNVADENNMRAWQIYKYNDLPKGTKIEAGTVLYLKPKRNKAAVEEHKVQEGESMWEISQKYGIKLKKLYQKNKMQPGTEILPGQTVQMRKKRREMPDTGHYIIPAPRKAEEKYNSSKSNPNQNPSVDTKKSQTNNTSIPSNKTPEHYPSKTSESKNETLVFNKSKNLEYKVEQGETLFAISKKLQIPIDSIIVWNDLPNHTIHSGLILYYYEKNSTTQNETPEQIRTQTKQENTSRFSEHVVKSGETLYGISRLYGVSVEVIKEANQMQSNELRLGQNLKIPIK
jgi:flagellum-specific peptidoglycan hydrolase FlgJ